MTLYDILGINKKSSIEEIKKQYKLLALKYHPDRNKNTEEKFKEITKAYDILGNPDKKKFYDSMGSKLKNTNIESIFELLNKMFQQENNIPKVTGIVKMTTQELYHNNIKKVLIKRWEQCEKCNCYGTYDGHRHQCSKCDGHGEIMLGAVLNDDSAKFKTKMCKKCNGSGIDKNVKLCKKCNGSTCIEVDYELDVPIPAGAYDGYVVIIENEGNYIPKDERLDKKQKTNVEIYIEEIESEKFIRYFSIEHNDNVINDKANIAFNINISFIESICGFKKNIEHISGETIEIINKNMLLNGDYIVYKNKGMPKINTDNENENTYGDLFIRINIERPELSFGNKMKIWQILQGTSYPDVIKEQQTESLIILDDY